MAKQITTTQERLKEALSIKNIRQIDLSRASGIPRDSISHYFRGQAVPSIERVHLMSEALGVNEVWLLGYDVPMIDD